MPSRLKWRFGLIGVVVILAFVAGFPYRAKVVRVEQITEKFDHGAWVEGKRKVLKRSWLSLITSPRESESAVVREYEKNGIKYRVRRVVYRVPGKIKLGLDLRGGAELLYRIRVKPEEDRPGIARGTTSYSHSSARGYGKGDRATETPYRYDGAARISSCDARSCSVSCGETRRKGPRLLQTLCWAQTGAKARSQ